MSTADRERQQVTELGVQSMGARSSGPVLGVACQPRRRSAVGDPARRAAFAKSEHAVDPDGMLSADERAKRADNLCRAHLRQMALKSAKARRLRPQLAQLKKQAGPGAEDLSGRQSSDRAASPRSSSPQLSSCPKNFA
jgi:hypothetical protein